MNESFPQIKKETTEVILPIITPEVARTMRYQQSADPNFYKFGRREVRNRQERFYNIAQLTGMDRYPEGPEKEAWIDAVVFVLKALEAQVETLDLEQQFAESSSIVLELPFSNDEQWPQEAA